MTGRLLAAPIANISGKTSVEVEEANMRVHRRKIGPAGPQAQARWRSLQQGRWLLCWERRKGDDGGLVRRRHLRLCPRVATVLRTRATPALLGVNPTLAARLAAQVVIFLV